MSSELAGNYRYGVSELAGRYARNKEYAFRKNFVLEGRDVTVVDIYDQFGDDMLAAGFPGVDKSEMNRVKGVDVFLGRYKGQSLQQVCTMVQFFSGELKDIGFRDEDIRGLMERSARKDLALAEKIVTENEGKDNGVPLAAWKGIRDGAAKFVEMIGERNNPSPGEVSK